MRTDSFWSRQEKESRPLLPAVCGRLPDFDLSADLNAAGAEFIADLLCRLKLHGIYALLFRGGNVLGDVVREKAFLGAATGSLDRFLVDQRRGLHGAYLIRKDQVAEVTENRVILLNHFEVDRVGVGEEDQGVPAREIRDHGIGDQGLGQKNRAPYGAEVIVSRA